MLKANEVLDHQHDYDQTLTLPYELRQKSRLKATLDNGSDIGLMLPRGTILRGGDAIKAEDGTVIMIKAAQETVSIGCQPVCPCLLSFRQSSRAITDKRKKHSLFTRSCSGRHVGRFRCQNNLRTSNF